MASGPVAGSILRRSESKVYTRKSNGKNFSKFSGLNPPPPSSNQTLATTTTATADDLHSSPPQPPAIAVAPPHSHRQYLQMASEDEASSLNRRPPDLPPGRYSGNRDGHRRIVTLKLVGRPPHEVRGVRRKLAAELDRVRDAIKRIETKELHLAFGGGGGGPYSQLSVNDATTPVGSKRAPVMSEAASTTPAPISRLLSVSVPPGGGPENSISESTEKEKRTPKANQLYRKTDFVLGKEKLPPPGSHKKSKSGGSKKPLTEKLDHDMQKTVEKNAYSSAFTGCKSLLLMLMHHEFGWVFNTPVDTKALGLYDYFTIIKQPMDLGTVKTRLSKNWYSTPAEFAEDVRITFRNAMTYNPKDQDVYKMAEHLTKFFEERWLAIEADSAYVSRPPIVSSKMSQPFDKKKTVERSDTAVQPMTVDSKPKQVNQAHHVGRTPALKKPKAKESNKRDMTFEEKQKLSHQLQSLPQEKLDNVLQIIKKRSSNLNQDDEEIEVDIDIMDPETLWELDRFVTNYKKSLSKYKRKAEIAMQERIATDHHNEEMLHEINAGPGVTQVATESKTEVEQKSIAALSPVARERKGDISSGSTGSSSSGSDTDSSDSGSESDSDSE